MKTYRLTNSVLYRGTSCFHRIKICFTYKLLPQFLYLVFHSLSKISKIYENRYVIYVK